MGSAIYTKGGDKGETGLVGGQRVSKSHGRLECYGTVDELNSTLGLALTCLSTKAWATEVKEQMTHIQNRLFNIGSCLACEDEKLLAGLPGISSSDVNILEKAIDSWTNSLPPLASFILPGGSPFSAMAHLARTICRRSERLTVKLSQTESVAPEILVFLNRLSDFLFVLARYGNFKESIADPTWEK